MSKSLLHFELGLNGRSNACRSIAERNDDSSLSASVRAELLCEERWCASAEWFEQTYFNCDDDWSVRWVAWERRMGEIRQGHSLGVVHELGDAVDTHECAQSNAFLRDAAHVAHERFFSRPDDFLQTFGDELALLDLYGTDAPQRCWRAHCAGDTIVSGALLCALYEQAVKVAMRGTLHWAEAQIQPVPRRISLLLADPRFVSFFPETFRFWFRGIVGAPPGLNLRNILWHGFASHGEFPARFTSLLFLFAVSSIRRFASPQLRMKDLVAACTMDVASHVRRSMCFHATVPRTSFREMKRALMNSFFILPRQVTILRNSLKYFEQPGCEDMALSGVFSTMEQALRRVYVFVRQSPERLLTAEDDALMTTLDTFLQDGQNPSSEFRKLIGDDAMLQLCDLFYHRDGPRLRDMLSHGVINCSSLPEFLISSVHSLVFRLLRRFSLVRESPSVPPYRPVYHPSVILAQTLRKMVHLSEAFEIFALQNALETEDQSIVDLIRACEERERRVTQLSSSFCSSSLSCLTAGSGDIVVEVLWENDGKRNNVIMFSLLTEVSSFFFSFRSYKLAKEFVSSFKTSLRLVHSNLECSSFSFGAAGSSSLYQV